MAFVTTESIQQNRAAAIKHKPRFTFRKLLLQLHLIIGLSFGTMLTLMGISGSVMLFEGELTRLFYPHLTKTGETGNPNADKCLAAVQAAYPGAQISQLRLSRVSGGSLEWAIQDSNGRQTVYTSPVSCTVLGKRLPGKDLLGFLHDFHHNWLIETKTARPLQGIMAVSIAILCLSGIILWWPRTFTLSRFKPRATARPLHYAIGFWSFWVLLAISLTAINFGWRQQVQKWVLGGVANAPQRPGNANQRREGGRGEGRREHADPLSLDGVLNAAHAAKPEATLAALRLPDHGREVTVMYRLPGENPRLAQNQMQIRPAGNGLSVGKIMEEKDLPANKKFLNWLPRIHEAEFGQAFLGGYPVRVVWGITGFMPAVLWVSGLLMWRRRVKFAK